jgi:hypothetical protein
MEGAREGGRAEGRRNSGNGNIRRKQKYEQYHETLRKIYIGLLPTSSRLDSDKPHRPVTGNSETLDGDGHISEGLA